MNLNELDLHARTRDEAMMDLEKFLNDAFMAGLYEVRVIHGKGTGTLRQTVRQRLAHHPLVRHYREGDPWEGGGGVTVVEFVTK